LVDSTERWSNIVVAHGENIHLSVHITDEITAEMCDSEDER
jgi:hypothetical protein